MQITSKHTSLSVYWPTTSNGIYAKVGPSYIYADEELDQVRQTRDPVAPAKPAASARRKKNTHRTADGLQGQPFSSLLEHLGTLTVNTCCMAGDPDGPSFQQESKRHHCKHSHLNYPTCSQYTASSIVSKPTLRSDLRQTGVATLV